MYFLRQGLNYLLFFRIDEDVDGFQIAIRIQSRELLLESGIARHAGKQLLAVLGLFQRQLLPQSAGTFLVITACCIS